MHGSTTKEPPVGTLVVVCLGLCMVLLQGASSGNPSMGICIGSMVQMPLPNPTVVALDPGTLCVLR